LNDELTKAINTAAQSRLKLAADKRFIAIKNRLAADYRAGRITDLSWDEIELIYQDDFYANIIKGKLWKGILKAKDADGMLYGYQNGHKLRIGTGKLAKVYNATDVNYMVVGMVWASNNGNIAGMNKWIRDWNIGQGVFTGKSLKVERAQIPNAKIWARYGFNKYKKFVK